MDLSKLSVEERRKTELEYLSKTVFSRDVVVIREEEPEFSAELRKHFGGVYITKLKIQAYNDVLWGSMGMQQFTNELLNHPSLKQHIQDLHPFEEFYELKQNVSMGGNLFNLLGDLCALIKQGGCYGDGSNLSNDEIIRITKSFIDDNLKEGYKMYHYIKLYEPWTKWFGHQPIYAMTFLMLSLYRDEMYMICIVDTD
jgi:hypothetical protein